MAVSNFIPSSRVMQPGVCTSTTQPASPYEGMVIYETDTDLLRIWNGSAWRTVAFSTPTSGSVLQVVYGTTTGGAVASSSSTVVGTGLSATITPTSTSSKILVMVTQSAYETGNSSMHFYLLRDKPSVGTQLVQWLDAIYGSSTGLVAPMALNYMDSPAANFAITYSTAFSRGAGSGTVYTGVNSNYGSMILVEIAG